MIIFYRYLPFLLSINYLLQSAKGGDIVFNIIQATILLYLMTIFMYFWIHLTGEGKLKNWWMLSGVIFLMGFAISGLDILGGALALSVVLWFLFKKDLQVEISKKYIEDRALLRVFYQQLGTTSGWIHTGVLIGFLVFYTWRLMDGGA